MDGPMFLIEIIVAKKGHIGRKGRVNAVGMQKIEGEQSLQEETIPFAKGICSVNCAKDGDEMVFQIADSLFCCIDSVFMGPGELKLDSILKAFLRLWERLLLIM
jgi:hypothetical protein